MRSRPEIKLYLDRETATPGGQIRAAVALLSRSETPIAGVEVQLAGRERYYGPMGKGRGATAVHTHLNLVARLPKAVLAPGEHRRNVRFDLPATVPPSYESACSSIEYELLVHVVIPWWPDRMARYLVPVIAPSSPAAGAPSAYCTDRRGPQGRALYLETSVESSVVALDGVVRGAVSMANGAHHRVRRLDLALVLSERQRSTGAVVEVSRVTVELARGGLPDGQALPFQVAFPEGAPPSIEASLVEVRWRVEIRAVVALGHDVTLACPITVFRPFSGAPRGASQGTRVPPVGRERRALVWAESARRNGLSSDAEEERMTLDVPGASLTVTLEPRKAAGLALVAAVAWPRLGIDLAVAERRWVDAWSGGVVPPGDPELAERFTVRGREAAQVRAFLGGGALGRAVLPFDEAAVGDEGASLVSAGTAQSVQELDAFVARAVAAARALGEAAPRVPAPAAMAAYVPAWRAFAVAMGGRLVLGEMSIHEATREEAPLVIATEWSDEGAPAATLVRFPLPERTGGAGEPRPLDGATKALVDSLSAQVAALSVSEEAVEVRLPAPLEDPAALEPILVGMAQLARRLSGGTARGPYR